MTTNDTIQAAAQWMLLELEADGQVSREYAAEHLAKRFGEVAVRETPGGGPAIDERVIEAFTKLAQEKTGHPAVYEGETWFLRLGNSPLL
ncbi:MAG TPA: hypothetical protein VK721_06070 [Solirubrobacteraceae bacterium]|jgi:hypothetical protein|nr:hypothetical protein [Solirubrobacteraceae bacterium]